MHDAPFQNMSEPERAVTVLYCTLYERMAGRLAMHSDTIQYLWRFLQGTHCLASLKACRTCAWACLLPPHTGRLDLSRAQRSLNRNQAKRAGSMSADPLCRGSFFCGPFVFFAFLCSKS